MSSKTVLITGITGFLGAHTAIAFLRKGYRVVGTLRDRTREASIRALIAEHLGAPPELSCVEIDLTSPQERWDKALRGVDYVAHIASPFPTRIPETDAEIVEPAVTGTLNVLRAATAHAVTRVIVCSSTGAAVYGRRKVGIFTEADWTDVTNLADTTPYFRSKTLAERAAWEYVEVTAAAPELVTILPGAILGPVLEKDFGTSANIVKKMLDGSMPAVPKIGLDCVDVRSVAEAFVRAVEVPSAAGERFLCSSDYLTFADISATLKKAYPDRKVPTARLPDFLVRLFSYVDPETKPILNDLNSERRIDHTKITTMLGLEFIGKEKLILDCAASLFTQRILS